MLCTIEIENSLSYAEKTEFSMIARDGYKKYHNNDSPHLNPVIIKDDFLSVWQIASIYGPNSSGKTNFLKSITNIFENICGTKHKLVGTSFAYDSSCKKSPTKHRMSFVLQINGSDSEYTEFEYGYEIDSRNAVVLHEWLREREVGTSEFRSIYVRTEDAFEVRFSQSLRGEQREIVEEIESNVTKKALFIRGFADQEIEPLKSIYTWCTSVMESHPVFTDEGLKTQINKLTQTIKKNKAEIDPFRNFLIAIDNGIKDVFLDKKDVLMVEHNVTGNKDSEVDGIIPFSEESQGTQKMAGIYLQVKNVFENGGLLVIDELDSKIHSSIFLTYLANFHKPSNNKAQLIFSAHSLVALNKYDVHPDEVYFAGKNKDEVKDGKSKLTRFQPPEPNCKEHEMFSYSDLYEAGLLEPLPDDITFFSILDAEKNSES